MTSIKNLFGILLMTALVATSCSTSDDNDNPVAVVLPTASEFTAIKTAALENQTQNFQFNADDGNINLTSAQGVQINISATCLNLNGNPVTGMVDLEYVELFDKGHMLTTNKPTMGALPNGDKALLISGGEFFIEATQNGQVLTTTCTVQLVVPNNLTGGADPAMTLWRGEIDTNDNLTWEEAADPAGQGGVFAEGGQYYAFLSEFGWSNIDRFYSDPRPKTMIKVQAPAGYDNQNSTVYLSYDGEDTGLANLDTYDAGSNLFSEHYGQIPIGLECHVIFITEDNGGYRYAIKAVTIVANDIISFTLSETAVVTEAQLVALINALP